MKRWRVFIVMMIFLMGLAGLALAQQGRPANPFVLQTRITAGSVPANFVVEPVYDRLIMAVAQQVVIQDAATFETQRTIGRSVTINASAISHDARMIALAAGRVIELWDIETGDLIASVEPPGANFVTAPLMFSADDSYLLFTANIPASQATRRSENDTDLLTWLWDVNAARRLGSSRLPGRVQAYSFFDYRNGNLYLLPNDTILAAAAGRFDLIELGGSSLAPVSSIPSDRFENDPVALWFSAYDDAVYARISRSASAEIRPVWQQRGRERQIIGDVSSRAVNPLLRDLYNYDYRSDFNYHSLTVRLDDLLLPITQSAREPLLRLIVQDNDTDQVQFELLSIADRYQIALDEGRARIALRALTGDRAVTIYNLATGQPEVRFIPALRANVTSATPFAFTARDAAIIVGNARYDARTGEPLIEQVDEAQRFEAYFFSHDSRHIITMTGNIWRVWDVDTGALLRTETIHIGADAFFNRFSADGSRLLLNVNRENRPGFRVYDIAADVRRTIMFESLPGMNYSSYTPNADWTAFAVRYNAIPPIADAPNGAIAIYTLDGAPPLVIAGADLPPEARDIFWLDEHTLAVTGRDIPAVDRVFGADYAPSGAPACLLERFPESAYAWAVVWENLAYYRDGSTLARLSVEACAAIDPEAVIRLLTPTPEGTPIPQATAAITRIAGVPSCLTESFPEQAVAYAREWRRLTDGLPQDQVERLTDLMCEGLRGRFAGGFAPGAQARRSETIAMTIDTRTGRRTLLANSPTLPLDPNAEALAYLEGLYRRVFNNQRSLSQPILSPDQRYIAENRGDVVNIYRLEPSYTTLAAEATATAVGTIGAQPRVIRVQPSATPAPEQIGLPRPTLTPTIVPTLIPPIATDSVSLPSSDQVTELCPHAQPIDWEDRPSDFAPTGRLLGAVQGVQIPAVLNPATRSLTLDETIPPCMFGAPCSYSLDREWIIDQRSGIQVMRPDGRDAVTLFTPADMPNIEDVRWVNRDQLLIQRRIYVEGQRNPVLLNQIYYPRDGRLSILQEPRPPLGNVNGLPTSVVSVSPISGDFVVLAVARPRPDGEGVRYYLVDGYGGRMNVLFETEPRESASFTWHPYEAYLSIAHSAYPNRRWRYYPRAEFYLLDEPIRPGEFSRDGRLLLSAFELPREERQMREERGEPVPTLRLISDFPGETRLYCLPSMWANVPGASRVWSPDGRYLALRVPQPNAPTDQNRSYFTVYILDTETGVVVDMRANMTLLTDWVAEGGGS